LKEGAGLIDDGIKNCFDRMTYNESVKMMRDWIDSVYNNGLLDVLDVRRRCGDDSKTTAKALLSIVQEDYTVLGRYVEALKYLVEEGENK